jgi:uncharacterized protein (TIGR01777 family)
MNRRIILAGGRGVLGQLLARKFIEGGDDIVVLTRRLRAGGSGREVEWDGQTLGHWTDELETATAVINLAGRSVDCRYHARNRRLILESRVNSTRVLGEAIARCQSPPRVWLNSSTATIYRHTFGAAWDESGQIGATPEAKDAFSVEVAETWEKAFAAAAVPLTRKVVLRTAMVLSRSGGVFPVLRRLVRLGLGGRMGHGRQFVSWIHEMDFVRAIDWLIGRDDFNGIVNVASPAPLPNADMMRRLRQALHRPVGLPAFRWMLELGAVMLRTETELIIKSRRVVPGRLLAAGFSFPHPTFDSALEELCREPATR